MPVFNNILAGASGATSEAAAFQIDRSIRLNSGDSAYLNRTPSSAGNRKTWTWSGWFKRAKLGTVQGLFNAITTPGSNTNRLTSFINTNNKLYIIEDDGGTNYWAVTDQVFRDVSAWYHLVFAFDTTLSTGADRVKVYVNGNQVTSFALKETIPQNQDTLVNSTIAHNIGLENSSDYPSKYWDGYLADIHFIDGQALAASDFGEFDNNGVWQPKEYSGTYGTNGFHLDFSDNSSASALGTDSSGNSNDWTVNNLIAVVPDELVIGSSEVSTSGTVTNPLNLFDGDVSTVVSSSDGSRVYWTPASNITVSKFEVYFTSQYNGYKIGIEVTGGSSQIITKDTSGSGNSPGWVEFTSIAGDTIGPSNQVMFRSYRSDDSDSGILGVSAVRVNDDIVVTVSGVSGVDSLIDSPTNGTQSDTGAGEEVSGNYCTWNPLHTNANLSDGNLKIVTNAASYDMTMGTFGMSSGKWYWEGTWVSGDNRGWGVGTLSTPLNDYLGSTGSWGYMYTGVKVQPGNQQSSYGNSFAAGDIVSVAFDADNGVIWFAKNGVWQNSATKSEIEAGTTTNAAFTGLTSGPYFPYTSNQSSATGTKIGNFGQRAFAYSAPSGYKALCTTNLPTPTIEKGSDYFDTTLYTGNGSTQTISGLDFSPDLVWIKNRAQADNHKLLDTVRGATEELESNTTDAEATNADGLTAFNSDGFALGADVEYNTNTESYVAWTWDAGDSNTSISAGSLNSSLYDQSQTWSSYLTCSDGFYTPATRAFNGEFGSTSDRCDANNPGSAVMVFEPTGGISGKKLEVWSGGTGNELRYDIDGTFSSWIDVSNGSSGGSYWVTVYDFSSSVTLNKFELTDDTNRAGLAAVRIDGKILVDSGVSVTNVPSIASTVRANASAGFSIVTWTGGTNPGNVAHGLGASPELIITKRRDSGTSGWYVYHKSLGAGAFLRLDSTNASASSSTAWDNTTPSSTVIYFDSTGTNPSGSNLAYCFAPVNQYSSFGSYEGNGSSDGPFVYTGFRPALVIYKNADSAYGWQIYDSTRDPNNVSDARLSPSTSNAEDTTASLDMLSNGFKIRSSHARTNNNGDTFVYAAFGDPFKTARAR